MSSVSKDSSDDEGSKKSTKQRFYSMTPLSHGASNRKSQCSQKSTNERFHSMTPFSHDDSNRKSQSSQKSTKGRFYSITSPPHDSNSEPQSTHTRQSDESSSCNDFQHSCSTNSEKSSPKRDDTLNRKPKVQTTSCKKRKLTNMDIAMARGRLLDLLELSSEEGCETKNDMVDIDRPRAQWTGTFDFRCSLLSFLIGAGDFLRFPLLVAGNGGAAFIIAYLILYIVFAYPLIFMEHAWGQFCSRGPGHCWKFARLFQGVGYAMIFINWIFILTYSTKFAWVVVFPLEFALSPDHELYGVLTKALNTSSYDRLDEFGELQTLIVLCNVGLWVLIGLFLLLGIQIMGRVAVYTLSIRTLCVSVLCVYALMLPHAQLGIQHVFTTDLDKLTDFHMWIAAAQQLVFSMALTFGVHLTYASYNHFNNQATHDALVISLGDLLASMMGTILTPAYLGFLSKGEPERLLHIFTNLTENKLLFVTLPKAFNTGLYADKIWENVFFFYVAVTVYFNISYNSEIIITGIMDSFNLRREQRKYVIVIVSLISFCLSLSMCSDKGFAVSDMLIYYTDTFMELVIAFIQVWSIAWVYGVDRFIFQTECTVGWDTTPVLSHPWMKLWWKMCWKYITPATLLFLFVLKLVDFFGQTSRYSVWASQVGNLIIVTVFLLIFGVMLVLIVMTKKSSIKKRIQYLTTPLPEWGPQYPQHRRILEMGRQAERLEKAQKKEYKKVTRFESLSVLSI